MAKDMTVGNPEKLIFTFAMPLLIASLVLARPEVLGYTGICLATPLAWIGAFIFLAIFYYINIARLSRKNKEKAQQESV